MGTARLGLRRQKGLASAAFDNWKVQRWSAKMSAGRALGAANDRPGHPVRAVSVISPEMGVNCPSHQPGLGRDWDGKPPSCVTSLSRAWPPSESLCQRGGCPASLEPTGRRLVLRAAQVAKVTMSPGGPEPGLQPDLGSTPGLHTWAAWGRSPSVGGLTIPTH